MIKNKIVATILLVLICVTAIAISSCDGFGADMPEKSMSPVINTVSPVPPTQSVPTQEPTGTPEITPTPEPTLVPTPEPTPTPIPTPTPNTKPVGTTSSHPDYEGKKIISLTFDDGPSGSLTPKLLDLLKSKNVRATFFVIGDMIAKEYDKENYSSYTISTSAANVLKRMHEEGHEIGNHTMSHYNLKKKDLSIAINEVNMLNNIVEEITGKRPTLFRPPYGNYTQEVRDNCGMTIVTWSIDSLDWEHISTSNIKKYAEAHEISQDEAKAILIDEVLFKGFEYEGSHHRPVMERLKHGSIILFHDIHATTKDAVAILLDYLEANDYVALPVTEMIMTEGPAPVAGQLYNGIRSK